MRSAPVTGTDATLIERAEGQTRSRKAGREQSALAAEVGSPMGSALPDQGGSPTTLTVEADGLVPAMDRVAGARAVKMGGRRRGQTSATRP